MMEKVKGYSGLILVGLGGLAVLSAIILGIFNARQYSEFFENKMNSLIGTRLTHALAELSINTYDTDFFN